MRALLFSWGVGWGVLRCLMFGYGVAFWGGIIAAYDDMQRVEEVRFLWSEG